jgi:hypothetical protein
MKLGRLPRTIATFVASLLVLLLVMSARSVLEARAAFEAASVALDHGDPELAIARLRASARWYTPFNPYAEGALARLEELGWRAEAAGDPARALSAYRAVHAAIMASRSFYVPHTDRLARADERIATLMASEPPAQIEQGRTPDERKAAYLALLVPRDPRPVGVVLAFLGLATWIGSAVAFVSWGVDSEGRILRSFARRSVTFLLVGWIAFAVGLRIA